MTISAFSFSTALGGYCEVGKAKKERKERLTKPKN